MHTSERRVRARPRVLPAAITLVAVAVTGACATHGSAPRGETDGRPRPRRPNVATERDFGDQSSAQVEELLVGRVPGVQVLQTPGGGLSVRVRGTTTVTGSAQPLYVVDGLPVQVGAEGLVGLNPRDIARIEVLKDAVQLAEYGVQGANGVVRITTKRAR
jgi:TonB-dependent SusC/RagA subfamily outer membrane receptor